MKKIVISAPGKIHLSGEHAVVYGKPALIVSLDRRLIVSLAYPGADIKFPVKNGQSTYSTIGETRKKDTYIAGIISVAEKKFGMKLDENIVLTINSAIPVGIGMGSSASLAVAVIGAALLWSGRKWNPDEINETAYEAEKIRHGNASGSDTAVVTYGGMLWYRKELDFLRTFWLLPNKLPENIFSFTLINTKRKESTKDMVGLVSRKQKEDKTAFTLLITAIEDVTRGVAKAIRAENVKELQMFIRKNERLLEDLGVVSAVVRNLVRDIEAAGGAAKISGAGGIQNGSGIVIAFHIDPQVISEAAAKYNFPAFPVRLGGEGVKVEQIIL